MKKYLQASFVFLLVCSIGYLTGSFVATSFDIKEWHELGRAMAGIMSVMIGGMLASFVITFED
jgi:fructose-specific phosphotransferase system IIC component